MLESSDPPSCLLTHLLPPPYLLIPAGLSASLLILKTLFDVKTNNQKLAASEFSSNYLASEKKVLSHHLIIIYT